MEILKKVEKRKQFESALRALLFSIASTLLFLLFLSIGIIYKIEFNSTFIIFTTGIISFIILYFIFKKTSMRSINEIAVDLDNANLAKNRLEAAVELKKSENPIKIAQNKDTDNFYSLIKIKLLLFPLIFVFIIELLLLSLGSYLTVLSYKISIAKEFEPKIYVKRIKKQVQPKKEAEKPDFAELAITTPESEMRAKPMDAVAWDGEGISTHGFRNLNMKFYVNGELKKSIKIDLNLKENKKSNNDEAFKITISGEFYLDELDVVPFDVVTYYLEGYSNRIANKGRKVVSIPQFIEVRPFREEAELLTIESLSKLKMDNKTKSKMIKLFSIIAMINKFIRFQLSMNKAVFALKSSGFDINTKLIQEQLIGITEDEDRLKKELSSILKEIPPDLISANMMDHLRSAVCNMDKAEINLKSVITPKFLKQLDLEKNDKQEGTTK